MMRHYDDDDQMTTMNNITTIKKGGKSDGNYDDDEDHDYPHKIKCQPTQITVCANSLQVDFIKSGLRENIAILIFFLSTDLL